MNYFNRISLLFCRISATFLSQKTIEKCDVNLKAFLVLGGVGFVLQGCTSMNALTSPSINSKKFNSPQEVIEQNNINENNSSAKEYVFDWGTKNKDKQVQSLIPRSTLSNYCLSQGGKFTLFQKSSMHLVRE